jgi:hypothetical protein
MDRLYFNQDNKLVFDTEYKVMTGVGPEIPWAGWSGLTAYYRCDDGSGTSVTEVIGNTYNLNYPSGIWVPGKNNTGIKFSNTDAAASTGDFSGIRISVQGSVSVWIYPTGSTSDYILVKEFTAGVSQSYRVMYNGSTIIDFSLNINGSLYSIRPTSSYPINNWYHIVGTFDNGVGIKAYVNGTKIGDGGIPGNSYMSTEPLRVGNESSSSAGFSGIIDELAFFNYCLTQQHVTDLYNNGNGKFY